MKEEEVKVLNDPLELRSALSYLSGLVMGTTIRISNLGYVSKEVLDMLNELNEQAKKSAKMAGVTLNL